MTARSVAIEGLPGAGKTSLIRRLTATTAPVAALPELVLEKPAVADLSFCVRNDLRKVTLCTSYHRVLLDRYWPSTVAYVLAETRLLGNRTDPEEVTARLYGTEPPHPTAYVFLDRPGAQRHAFAQDGWFGDPRFRRLLRHAYYEIFASATAHVLTVHHIEKTDAQAFVRRHLDLEGS